MKNDFISILCIAIVCATVMLGIMGLYRLIGPSSRSGSHIEGNEHVYSVTDVLYPGMSGSKSHGLR